MAAVDPARMYKYRHISRDHLETHLLTLHPGLYNDEIHIHLAKARLSVPDDELAEYEALSYAWGHPEMTHTVTVVDGDDDDCWPGGTLPITGSMDTALRCLRLRHRRRVLWIDALCINQSDVQERNHQVQWMDQVYRKARRVVIFLGAESDADTRAVAMLTSIGASLDVEGSSVIPWLQVTNYPLYYHDSPLEEDYESSGGPATADRMTPRTLKGSAHFAMALVRLYSENGKAASLKLSEQRKQALSEYLEHDGVRATALRMNMAEVLSVIRLIQRPWFSRLWVIQEVRTMREPDEAILQYGARAAVSWEQFRKGIVALRSLRQVDLACQTTLMVMGIQMYLVNMCLVLCQREVPLSIREFLSLQNFHCADPRDRIYGVLSLLRDELGYSLAVDYTASVEAVFEDFQRRELRVRGPWLLPFCHLDANADTNPQRRWDAPSWVPNQRSAPTHLHEINWVPTSRFAVDLAFVSDRCLRVYGCRVATVRTVVTCPPLPERWSPDDGPSSVISWCRRVASDLCGEAHPPLQRGEDRQRRLSSKILGLCDIRGDYIEARTHMFKTPYDYGLRRRHMEALILSIFALPEGEPVDSSALASDLVRYLIALYISLRGAFGYSSRPIVFTTDADDVGYGPGSTRPGDQVCAILGCQTDLLLRPIAATRHNNDGQDETENINGRHIIVGPVSVANNIRSEKVLGPLPKHVYLAQNREGTKRTFVDSRTQAMIHDPRLVALGLGEAVEGLAGTQIRPGDFKVSVEQLRQRGVHLEPFFLE
ncbi:hypothetical protein S40293_09843 [Stachybotrys chartarum IBT 40293]|nr:hypothetical protein S40293_09843 [Stachybotrys chartarum IBT 40293]